MSTGGYIQIFDGDNSGGVGTDDQQISGVIINSDTLRVTLEDGGGFEVDLPGEECDVTDMFGNVIGTVLQPD